MESTLYALTGGTLGLLIVVFAQILKLQKRVATVSRVDAKVDVLLQHAGIEFDPFEQVTKEVRDARKGGKIDAIRRYRESSGVSLKEAKEFAEELQRRADLGK